MYKYTGSHYNVSSSIAMLVLGISLLYVNHVGKYNRVIFINSKLYLDFGPPVLFIKHS